MKYVLIAEDEASIRDFVVINLHQEMDNPPTKENLHINKKSQSTN